MAARVGRVNPTPDQPTGGMPRPPDPPVEIVRTDDGSLTLHSLRYAETYHSRSGAWQQATERYVRPCRVVDSARAHGRLRLLDIGFGLGWNLAWTLLEVRRMAPWARIEVVSLERDLLPTDLLRDLHASFPEVEIRGWLEALVRDGSFAHEGVSLQLRRAPAEQEIEQIAGPFDAVFLDPFSPGRNPELWTARFVQAVRARTEPGGILSTYSSATRVRLALLQAGWSIGKGPRVGTKSSGTLASNGPVTPPLPSLPDRDMRRLSRRAAQEVDKP